MQYQVTISDPLDPTFSHDVIVEARMNFQEFNDFLIRVLQLDQAAVTSIFLSDEHWARHTEFAPIEQDEHMLIPTVLMGKAILQDYIPVEHTRFVFLYDLLSDRELHLEVVLFMDPSTDLPMPYDLGGSQRKQRNQDDPLSQSNADIADLLKDMENDPDLAGCEL